MLKKIAIIIGILVLIVIVWGLTFGDGGVVQLVWDGAAGRINDLWRQLSGSADGILPEFGDRNYDGSDGLNLDQFGG